MFQRITSTLLIQRQVSGLLNLPRSSLAVEILRPSEQDVLDLATEPNLLKDVRTLDFSCYTCRKVNGWKVKEAVMLLW